MSRARAALRRLRGLPLVPLAVASALLMELAETAALATALPVMARDLGVDPFAMKTALTAYLVTVAALASASGWVADRLGPRRVFLAAMAVYLSGSIACALAPDLPQLVAARVLQGLGGAMMTPVARAIVVASSPKERLVSAINWFTIPAILGPLLGPPLAGVVLEAAGWRWIFLMNLPVGVLGLAAVLKLVPVLPARADRPRFDLLGFLLADAAILAFMGASEAGAWAWPLAGGGVAALAAFVLHARRTPQPVLQIRLLARRTVAGSLGATALQRIGIGAYPFLLPLMLQTALGFSPLRTGWSMMAMTAGALAARFAATPLLARFGFKRTMIAFGAVAAVTMAAPAAFRPETPLPVLLGVLAVVGVARAAFFVPATTLGYAEVSPEEINQATTLAAVVQQLSLATGVTLGAGLLRWAAPDGRITPQAFGPPFLALAVIAGLGVVALAGLPKGAADHLRPGRVVTPD